MNPASTKESLSLMAMRPSLALPAEDEQEVVEAAQKISAELCLEQEQMLLREQILEFWPEDSTTVIVVDDYSTLPLASEVGSVSERAGRAWVRTRAQDVLLTPVEECSAYCAYLSDRLGLPAAPREVLVVPGEPASPSATLHRLLAEDVYMRRLISSVSGKRIVLHPYIGSEAAWRVAKRLSQHNVPCKMLAPLPSVARLVNNKNRFLQLVVDVLGPKWAVEWREAASVAACVSVLKEVAQEWGHIAVKIDNGACGIGTREIMRDEVINASEQQLEAALSAWLTGLKWKPGPERALQVARWDETVIVSPSIHVLIPPLASGHPVVEGVTDQIFDTDDPHRCMGACTTTQPADLIEIMEGAAAKLARLFQHLGYVGRCSFDTVVCFDDNAELTLRFVECNGRWGATTLVLCLLNRLFGDFSKQPFWHQEVRHPKLVGLSFAELRKKLEPVLYDASSGQGWLILHNIFSLSNLGAFDAIVLGNTVEQARERLLQCTELLSL